MAKLPWNSGLLIIKMRLCLPLNLRRLRTSRSHPNNYQDGSGQSTRKFNVKMIPAWMRAHLFAGDSEQRRPPPSSQCSSQKYFDKNADSSMKISSVSTDSENHTGWEDVKFNLPDLKGNSLQSHFESVGESEASKYYSLLITMTENIPTPPHQWVFQPGWTRYACQSEPESVPFPDDDALILDVEVCVPEGNTPSIASAVSPNAWYSWVSPSVICGSASSLDICTVNDMIPLGNGVTRPRIVVGHNVCYDKARVKNAYSLESSGLRYFDTMSAHVCISGVTNLQRFYLHQSPEPKSKWMQSTSSYSLSQLHKFYCKHLLDKSPINHFVEGSSSDIKEHFQELMTYCANDVIATHSVVKEMLPVFMKRFPHPISLIGLLELSTMYMPINAKWTEKLKSVEEHFSQVEEEIALLLREMAHEACQLLYNDIYHQDPWMWDQDWSIQKSKKSRKFDHNPKVRPGWYRSIEHKVDSSSTPLVTTGMHITPKLMELCWKSYPLHFIRGSGWGMLIPSSPSHEIRREDGIPVNSLRELCLGSEFETNLEVSSSNVLGMQKEIESSISFVNPTFEPRIYETEINLGGGVIFRKIPHIRGIGFNVGSPFSKEVIMNPALNSRSEKGQRVLSLLRKKMFWPQMRKKLKQVPIVWDDATCQSGACVPQSIVCGDFKRHPTEDVFGNLLSYGKSTLAIELFEAIEAPSNWIFLSTHIPETDFWVASSLSDGKFGEYGSTELGRLFLEKQIFSHVASLMSMKESQVRLFCYAVLFGAQKSFLSKIIWESDTSLSDFEAKNLADKLFSFLVGHNLYDVSAPWKYGIMSELWNKLDDIVQNPPIKTPILNSCVSKALESEPEKFLPLLRTWIIQSSKVDFLHLLLVCFRDLESSARLCLSTPSDAICFLVPQDKQYHAARSLHFAHLMARAFCALRMGLTDLPCSTAFLPSVKLSKSFVPESETGCQNLSILEAVRLASDMDQKEKKQNVVRGMKQPCSSSH